MSKLFVVGTGPGDLQLLAPKAASAIQASSDLVAYGLYLDLLGQICEGKTHHDLPLGEEIGRARLALDLAASGKTTALISSGDIGIYAMATLVFELLDQQLSGKEQHPEWLDVEIEVIPGISAMQAGASRVGALLGHDFCTISLSDLLTPWPSIQMRVKAAAAANAQDGQDAQQSPEGRDVTAGDGRADARARGAEVGVGRIGTLCDLFLVR